MKHLHVVLILSLLLLAGCVGLLSTDEPVENPETQVSTPTPTSIPASPSLPEASPTPAGPTTLRVWLPPQFNPDADTPAARLLRARLDEFSKRRPDMRIEVRIKAAEGPGGLLDSLTTTSAAAPLAVPDLIALPRPLMETASLKGLLHPYDDLIPTMEEVDWYEYAHQMAQLQNSVFGLPFAGDALVLVYRPAIVSTPPASWQASLETASPLIFPAADQQALFTLAQYQSLGEAVQDDQGRPFLDAAPLSQVLAYYQQAQQAGVMPFWLTQYQSDEQAWEAFVDSQSDMVITWSSRYLANLLADTAAAQIPTRDGNAYTLAGGWVWALASTQPERQVMGAQLAEFLTDSSFLAKWTEASGYLPTRSSALSGWTNASLETLVSELVNSAHLYPATDVLISLGPSLQQATVQVLKEQSDPLTAAQDAVRALVSP
jgi:ABC-type glycerol-3-phosphate transport system substrate-binding protein